MQTAVRRARVAAFPQRFSVRRARCSLPAVADVQQTLLILSSAARSDSAGVFGQRLEETVLYERRYGLRLVPLVVEQCVAFIRERGLQEVGLFRQPGRASLVKELQEAFDSGERPSFDRYRLVLLGGSVSAAS